MDTLVNCTAESPKRKILDYTERRACLIRNSFEKINAYDTVQFGGTISTVAFALLLE